MEQARPEGPGIQDANPGPHHRLGIAEHMDPSLHLEIQASSPDARQGLQEESLGDGGFGRSEGPGWVNTGTRLIHSQKASQ